MPALTGTYLSVRRFLESAAPRIPNLAGVKFTFEAMDDYRLCQDFADGAYDILWCRDNMLLGALATGAKGGVGSTYNVATPLYTSLIEAFNEGDLGKARVLQSEACRLIGDMAGSGHFFGALKHLLSRQGLPIPTTMRANDRVQVFGRDGSFVRVLDGPFRMPSVFASLGDHLAIGELAARIVVCDPQDRIVARLGDGGRHLKREGWKHYRHAKLILALYVKDRGFGERSPPVGLAWDDNNPFSRSFSV